MVKPLSLFFERDLTLQEVRENLVATGEDQATLNALDALIAKIEERGLAKVKLP
ncbi:MAG: hypothetical protein IH852_09190 [Bacteroidetes bacterium]|nr:hypothetical protein [Bacteroidota bacterium]